MRGLKSLDLEFDGTGPKLRFGLWEAMRPAKSFTERLGNVRSELNLAERASRGARKGIPTIDSTVPSALELEIDNRYLLLADEEVQAAADELSTIGAELALAGTDVIESENSSIKSDLDGALATTETQLATDLPRPIHDLIGAQADIDAFDEANDTANEPTNRSFFLWGVYGLVVALAEAVINSLMLKQELGILPGAGFALVIGLGLAAIGNFIGIGVAQLKRRQKVRRILGGLLLFFAVLAGFYFLMAMGHYRTALHSGVADAVQAAKASFAADKIAPLNDFSILPYLVLNIVGMIIIAAKAVPMFAYLDLRRLRHRRDDAERLVNEVVTTANGGCDQAQHDARAAAHSLVGRAEANHQKGEQMLARCGKIISRCGQRLDRCAEAALQDHQHFREIIGKVHPGRGRHERFKTPTAPLVVEAPAMDQSYAATVQALNGRYVTIRDALPEMLEAIDAAANSARERIAAKVTEIEDDARSGVGGNVANLFRFRRAGEK